HGPARAPVAPSPRGDRARRRRPPEPVTSLASGLELPAYQPATGPAPQAGRDEPADNRTGHPPALAEGTAPPAPDSPRPSTPTPWAGPQTARRWPCGATTVSG